MTFPRPGFAMPGTMFRRPPPAAATAAAATGPLGADDALARCWLWAVLAALVVLGAFLAAGAEPIKAAAMAAACGAAAGILREPRIGLFFLLLSVQSNLAFVVEIHHGVPDIGRALVLYIGVVLLARGAFEHRVPHFDPAALQAPTAFLLAIAASLFFAEYPGRAEEVLFIAAKDVLVMILVVALMDDLRQFRLAAWTWILVGGCLGSLVTLQVLTGSFDQTFGGFASNTLEHIVDQLDAPRPSGPLPDPNFFAQSMLPIVPVALDRLVHARRRVVKLVAGWALAVSVLAIVFSYSRGALLALAVFGLMLVWRHRRSPVLWICVLLVGTGLAIAMPEPLAARLQKLETVMPGHGTSWNEEPAVAGRLGEMTVALEMFREHPLLGVGAGNYQMNFQRYSLEHGQLLRGEDRAAHSLYLQTAAEKGLLGLAVLGFVLWASFRGILQSRRRLLAAGQTDAAHLVTAFGAGFLLYLIAALFLHDSFARYFWSYVGVALALPRAASAGALSFASKPGNRQGTYQGTHPGTSRGTRGAYPARPHAHGSGR